MLIGRRAFLAAAGGAALKAGQAPAGAPPATRLDSSGVTIGEVPSLVPMPAEQITGRYAGRRWSVQRIVDADDTSAVLTDIRFASAERGIAVGVFTQKGREESQALITRDGGKAWTPVKLKDYPYSVGMIDESRAYIVGQNAFWFTNEGGAVWQKRKLPRDAKGKPMFRADFVDEKRGWIFGGGRTFFSTEDGGMSWRKVPESAALTLKDENTEWTWMNRIDTNTGIIVGLSASPPREASRFPDWMMPERALRRSVTPSTTVLGETRDGGKTWKMSMTSAFGRVTRLRTLGLRGLALYHYGDGMEFPSEVYSIGLGTGRSRPLFRRRDLWVHDAIPLHDGGVMLAAIEPPGRLRASPIPGRLRIFLSTVAGVWHEMKVDYRAAGRRAFFARVDDRNIWVATDEGTILKLTESR
jgi:hypothetical protein